MEDDIKTNNKKISVIGIIPKYPKHSQYNIYAHIRMPPLGIISVLSQINHDERLKEVYAIDENNGLIKIYEELIKRIEGSRSVVINDAVKYAEHTKQIKKLQNEINNIKELQRKYK